MVRYIFSQHNPRIDFSQLVSFDKKQLEQALLLAQKQLQDFGLNPEFSNKMRLALGEAVDATELREAWIAGDFTLPSLEICSRAEIGGASGAYAGSTNTIYLAHEFLSQNNTNLEPVARVLLEEIGHALDWQLNQTDSQGDEGAIFSALVRGDNLTKQQLWQLKTEDDWVTVALNGQPVLIEQATLPPDTILYHPTLSGEEIQLLADAAFAVYDDIASLPGWGNITPNLDLDNERITGNSYKKLQAGAAVFQKADTLILAFRGSDTIADSAYWASRFLRQGHYTLFNELFAALGSYINENKLSKLLVTGHSLGGAMVEYFMTDNPGNQYAAVAFASPEASFDVSDTRLLNIGHDNDIVYSAVLDKFPRTVNSTTKLNIAVGPEHFRNFTVSENLSRLVQPHYQGHYPYTTERVLNSVYYNQMRRDSLVIIDRTDSEVLTKEFSSFGPFAETAFILGEADDEDRLRGYAKDDVLEGLGGNDTLIGDEVSTAFFSGDDTLDGGAGDDTLNGRGSTDTAVFTDAFENYDYSLDNDTKIITFTHARGTQADGIDLLENVEFAQFSDHTVPLPLEDGPEDTEQANIFDVNGQNLGVASLTLPTYMFDGDADYTVTLSSAEQGIQSNFAYIIDISASMAFDFGIFNNIIGVNNKLTDAKTAYVSLTDFLINSGVAEVSQFAVIPFFGIATLNADLNATEAKTIVQGLVADSGFNPNSGTNFNAALEKAIEFFSRSNTNATNIAYFLSDGEVNRGGAFSSNAAQLQNLADVRAFGIGSADLGQLNIVDSNNAILLNSSSDLEAEFSTSEFSRNEIAQINILLNGQTVDIIQPTQLEDSTLGLSYSGSINGLSVAADAENEVTAEVIFADFNRPATTVDFTVTSGQGIGSGTAQDDLIRLGATDIEAEAGAGNDKVVGNNLSNTLNGGLGNDQIVGGGGSDRIIPGAGDDLIDGGDGVDTVVYFGTQTEVGPVQKVGDVITVGSNTDTLTNVEFIEFADTRLSTQTLEAVPILNVADITVSEGNAGTRLARFSFNLSSPADTEVQVSYQTVDGNATADSDYTPTSGQITIPIGRTSTTVDVEVQGDSKFESDEVFALSLSKLSGATFENYETEFSAVAQIDNDDINNPPVADVDKTLIVNKNTTSAPLNITAPTDPEGDFLTITVITTPNSAQGEVRLADGTPVTVGQELIVPELENLVFAPQSTASDNLSSFSYLVSDPYNEIDFQVVTLIDDDVPNEINGTSGRDQLTGTNSNDIITGFQSRDLITTRGGEDQVVYTSMLDSGDTITDFEVGSDQIVLTGVFESIGFSGTDPFEKGYLQIGSQQGRAFVQIDPDGFEGPDRSRSLVMVEGVTVEVLKEATNFVF